MTDSNILTRKQLAENLDVNRRTIARWEKEGLPVMVVNSRTKRYNYQSVLDWMEERKNNE